MATFQYRAPVTEPCSWSYPPPAIVLPTTVRVLGVSRGVFLGASGVLRRRVLLGPPLAYCSCFWTHTAVPIADPNKLHWLPTSSKSCRWTTWQAHAAAPPSVHDLLFRVRLRLRRRLRGPICDGRKPVWQPLTVLPVWGATESNSLLACRTQAAGLQTEVEKPGLLPPHVNGAPEDGVRRLAGRRPADVWSGLRSPKAYAFEHKIVCVAEGLNSFPWSSRLLAGRRRPPCRPGKLEGNRWRPKPMRVQKRRRRTWSHPTP